MELKSGYAETDAGIFPADWRIVQLGDYVDISSGETPSAFKFTDSGIPYYKVEQLSNRAKYLDSDATPYHFASGKKVVPKGSILFAKRGAAIELNKVRILSQGSFMDTNLMALTAKQGLISEYLYYRLGYTGLWKFADTTSVPQINNKHIKPLLFPLPPIAEQLAIVEALSAADAYVESLEQVLAKKHAIFESALQELLAGNRRLPGFHDPWVEKRLGDTALLKARIGWQGLTTAEYLDDGNYCLVTGTDFKLGRIDWKNCHYVEYRRYIQDKNIQLSLGDVLVTKDGTIGKVAFVGDLPMPATLNSGVFVIRPLNAAFYPKFFFYVLRSQVFEKFLVQLSAGSTINHLYQKDFVDFLYFTPSSIEEQKSIASLLSDAEAEVSAIDLELTKARNIKQGMMQQLLTGKVRLS